jgi:hypothetical protein
MGSVSTSVTFAVGAGVGALVSALGALILSILSRRELQRLVSVVANEERAALAAVDRLRATQQAVDRLTLAVAGSQAWFWAPEWQAGEREADTDLAEGRFTRFSSVEEMDAALAEVPQPFAASK